MINARAKRPSLKKTLSRSFYINTNNKTSKKRMGKVPVYGIKNYVGLYAEYWLD